MVSLIGRSPGLCVYRVFAGQTDTVEPTRGSVSPDCSAYREVRFGFNDALDSLSSCAALRDLKSGSSIHAATLKRGFEADTIIGNSLLNMYSKCGCIEEAARVFECMPERTVVSWTSMMSAYSELRDGEAVFRLFRLMLQEVNPNEFSLSVLLKACANCTDPRLVDAAHGYVVKLGRAVDGFLLNSLVDAYAKCGNLRIAEVLIGVSEHRDVVSWTSLISTAVENGDGLKAMSYFFMMQEDGVLPNEITILSILRVCSLIGDPLIFQWVHGLILKVGWWFNDFVLNSLLEMYLVNECFIQGLQVFCKFLFTNEDRHIKPETLAVIIRGCSRLGFLELGKQIHGHLIKQEVFPSLVVENSLICIYATMGCADLAFKLFEGMPVKDIVSWNSMVSGLVRSGNYGKAIFLFKKICNDRKDEQSRPDFVTVLAILQACSSISLYQLGQTIHGYITKTGLVCDIFVQNALIDMYGRTGRSDLAMSVFRNMTVKDLASYNSIIMALGINGDGVSALDLLDKLKKSGIKQPNAITFVCVLSACAYAGMVEQGLRIFNSMEREYGVGASMEHYACVVDMLARSGNIDEAQAFMETMPMVPGPAVWGALLGGGAIFGRVDVAEKAATWLSALDPLGQAWRIAMSNVYAGVGRWEDALALRVEVKELDGKEAAWSSVLVQGENVTFTVNDTEHPQSKTIYKVLDTLANQIRNEAMDVKR